MNLDLVFNRAAGRFDCGARTLGQRKALDLIVANPVPETFNARDASVTFVDWQGEVALDRLPKAEVADLLLDRITALWAAREAP